MTQCPTPVFLKWEHLAPERKLVGYYESDLKPYVLDKGVVRSPCKRWACTHCGTGKRAEAAKFMHAGAAHGLARDPRQPLRFVTITYGRDRDMRFDRADDVRQSSEDWRRLVQMFRRQGRTMEYARVLERTKRGRIHIHAITWGDWIPKCTDRGRRSRGLPTTREIKAAAAKSGPVRTTGSLPTQSARNVGETPAAAASPCYCTEARPCIQRLAWAAGFGWVEVRAIRSSGSAVAYTAKYLGKQTTADWPRYARRISYSRRFADGLTMGDIHAGWVATVRARLAELGELEEVPEGPVRWIHLSHPGEVYHTRAPPRLERPDHFGRPFNCHTGELLA